MVGFLKVDLMWLQLQDYSHAPSKRGRYWEIHPDAQEISRDLILRVEGNLEGRGVGFNINPSLSTGMEFTMHSLEKECWWIVLAEYSFYSVRMLWREGAPLGGWCPLPLVPPTPLPHFPLPALIIACQTWILSIIDHHYHWSSSQHLHICTVILKLNITVLMYLFFNLWAPAKE